MSAEDITSFLALRVEVLMAPKYEGESFWVVPKYTDADRFEVSIDDLAVILRTAEFFGVPQALLLDRHLNKQEQRAMDLLATAKPDVSPRAVKTELRAMLVADANSEVKKQSKKDGAKAWLAGIEKAKAARGVVEKPDDGSQSKFGW